jgi:hypothetical protein
MPSRHAARLFSRPPPLLERVYYFISVHITFSLVFEISRRRCVLMLRFLRTNRLTFPRASSILNLQ